MERASDAYRVAAALKPEGCDQTTIVDQSDHLQLYLYECLFLTVLHKISHLWQSIIQLVTTSNEEATSLALPSSFWDPANPRHSPHTRLDLPVPGRSEIDRQWITWCPTLTIRSHDYIQIRRWIKVDIIKSPVKREDHKHTPLAQSNLLTGSCVASLRAQLHAWSLLHEAAHQLKDEAWQWEDETGHGLLVHLHCVFSYCPFFAPFSSESTSTTLMVDRSRKKACAYGHRS